MKKRYQFKKRSPSRCKGGVQTREHVVQTIATRRAERDARYQQAVLLCEQGGSVKQIACRLDASERTVRHWFERGVAPDTRPRRKRQSDFNPYAPYMLKRWQDGECNGTRLWQEIAAQGYSGSQRMVYRFLKTLNLFALLKQLKIEIVCHTVGLHF